MRVEGSNGSVEYLEDRIIIRRKGIANLLTQGIQGDKTVPLARITAVQFRPAGSVMAGYIQFTIQGSRAFRGGMAEVTRDENAVSFTREQEPAFVRLRELVESVIIRGDNPSPTAESDIKDLAKLADLYEKGYLTKEEFDDRKRNILSPSAVEDSADSIRQRVSQQVTSTLAPEPTHAPREDPPRKSGLPWWVWVFVVFGVLILLSMLGQKAHEVPDHGDHWRKVGELGGDPYVRFVEVDSGSAHDGAVYRDAADKLCGAGSDCWQLAVFLPGDQVPPSGDKASFFNAGGWANYAPAAVWSGNEFNKWDCAKAGAADAPLSALCGAGAKKEYDSVLHLAARVGWTISCHLSATKDRKLVENFAARQGLQKRDQLMQAFDQMEKESESRPDNPADCQNLRTHIEDEARKARKALSVS